MMVYYGIKIAVVQSGQEGDLIPISMAWVYSVVPLTGAIMAAYLIYLIFYWVEPDSGEACEWLPKSDGEKVS